MRMKQDHRVLNKAKNLGGVTIMTALKPSPRAAQDSSPCAAPIACSPITKPAANSVMRIITSLQPAAAAADLQLEEACAAAASPTAGTHATDHYHNTQLLRVA
jgi:hypothetical protein